MNRRFKFFLCLLLCWPCLFHSSNLHSFCVDSKFLLGPEIYHVHRVKKGCGSQDGTALGFRGSIEANFERHGFLATNFLVSSAHLSGKNSDSALQSKFINNYLEIVAGYNFFFNCFACEFKLTPFFGYGSMWENNSFKQKKPIRISFRNQLIYFPLGFHFVYKINDRYSTGVTALLRYIWDGAVQVKDPFYKKLVQRYEEHPQYRLEAFLNFCIELCKKNVDLSSSIFYEYRHYGSAINFPFDFIDTKFEFWGINLKLAIPF